MKNEIKVPSMGESISEATVGNIIKPSGSLVAMDDEILELETDKVNQVLYAQQAGLVTLTVQPEDVVKIGQVIGFIEAGEGKGSGQKEKAAAKEIKAEPSPTPPSSTSLAAGAESIVPIKEAAPQASVRLTKEAWLEELKRPQAVPKKESSPVAQERPSSPPLKPPRIDVAPLKPARSETRSKMSKIRRLIAARLVEVQQATAMLTTFNEVDMSAVIGLRDKYKESFAKEHGVKLGFMSFFVKACTSALKAFPEINSYIDGEDLVHREYIDIGIAVGTPKGLIVPVVRSCNQQTFAQIEQSIEAYAKKAREGGLSVDDLQGAGFTITNGGVYGSLLSTPIINPPQCAILGMHKIMKRAVVVDDQIAIRQMMYLALSYDHRIVDGKQAVSFLVHIKNCLEDPARLLLEVS